MRDTIYNIIILILIVGMLLFLGAFIGWQFRQKEIDKLWDQIWDLQRDPGFPLTNTEISNLRKLGMHDD